MPLFLKALDPDIDIFGNRQSFHFNNEETPDDNKGFYSLVNHFAPTAITKLESSLDILDKNLSGFRLFHEQGVGETYGDFYLQKHSVFGASEDIFKYDEASDKVIFYKDVEFVGGGGGTVTSVGISGSTGLNVSGSPITSSGSIALSLSSNLQNLSGFAGSGLISRSSNGSFLARTLQAGTGITITNADGTQGNPVISSTGSSLTLTGAITGSGSGTINTTLGENQSLPFSYLQNNWSSGVEKGVYHTLVDAATPPHFVHVVQSGSGSTYRRWLTVYKPGFGSQPTGSYQLGFYHAANGHQYPFEIGTLGSTLRTYLRTTVDINNNKIINLAEPSSNNDAATKNYVDNEIESAVTPAIFQDAIKHLSYYALIDLSSNNSGNLGSSDHCPFNNIRSNNDPENLMNLSTSTYSTATGNHSLGRVKLRAGYIYKIRGFVSSTGTSSYFGFSLYNVTSSTYRFGTYGSSFADASQDNNVDSSPSIGYIKAAQDTLIELRKTGGTITQWYMGNSNLSGCWLDIQVIGKI